MCEAFLLRRSIREGGGEPDSRIFLVLPTLLKAWTLAEES